MPASLKDALVHGKYDAVMTKAAEMIEATGIPAASQQFQRFPG